MTTASTRTLRIWEAYGLVRVETSDGRAATGPTVFLALGKLATEMGLDGPNVSTIFDAIVKREDVDVPRSSV